MEQPDLPASYADLVALLTDSNLGVVRSERTDTVSFAFEHCQQRVRERYVPLVLTYDTWLEWNSQIQNRSPAVLYLAPALRGSTRWCVWLEETPILALYRNKRVVTVLPKRTGFTDALNRAWVDRLLLNLGAD